MRGSPYRRGEPPQLAHGGLAADLPHCVRSYELRVKKYPAHHE